MTAPDEVTAMAMRVAVGRRRKEEADLAYRALQADAHQVFADYRRRGIPQVEVRTPDGTKVALISIKTGARIVHMDEDVLTGVIAVSEPEAFEDYALPAAFTDPDVLAMLIEHFPQHVAARINRDVLAQYEKEAGENDGRMFWRDGSHKGEQVKVAEIEHLPATGDYSVRWEAKGMSLLGDAIDAGQVSEWGEIVAARSDSQPDEDVPGPGGPTISDPEGATGVNAPAGLGHPSDPDDTNERLKRARESLDKQARAARSRRTR